MDAGKGAAGIFGSGFSSDKLKYYCMNCGEQHSQAACPKCGSKMKRVGSQILRKLLPMREYYNRKLLPNRDKEIVVLLSNMSTGCRM